MLPRDTHIPLIALQLFIDSVSSKECMTASHRHSAVKDGHQSDVIILMQLNNPPPPPPYTYCRNQPRSPVCIKLKEAPFIVRATRLWYQGPVL